MSAIPAVPNVERVRPLPGMTPDSLPGVFFFEGMENISDLGQSFQDVSTNSGYFKTTTLEYFSGLNSLRQEYLPLTRISGDPGNAGWAMRVFGDSPLYASTVPAEQQHHNTTVVAHWYHKFEAGFTPRDSLYPNKMARLRCYNTNTYSSLYILYFWIDGTDGHVSIEAETKVPGAHREWLPNHYTNFLFSDPQNIGRWIQCEMRVTLGDGPRSDRVQAWADGLLICDEAGMDLAAGYKEFTPNAMMWDCYWNGGSPVQQSRYYDDLTISTLPIGPARTATNPVIVKSKFVAGDGVSVQAGWEAEVAEGSQKPMRAVATSDGMVTRYAKPELDCRLVWRGAVTGAANSVTVDALNGSFEGPRQGQSTLAANTLHFVRVRQQDSNGEWSAWSGWHAGFATTWAPGTVKDERSLPAGYMTETPAAVIEPDSTAPGIEGALCPGSSTDTLGPYTVSARVSDDHFMDVFLYYRVGQDSVYTRLPMDEAADGVYSADIPGQPYGSLVRCYIRARDLQWNTTFAPKDYASAPWSFRVLDGDFNADGRVGTLDVLSLILHGLKNPQDPAVDFNLDGVFSAMDAVALAQSIIGGRRPQTQLALGGGMR